MISLVCVQSLIQLMNTQFITFLFMIKDFSISFSRVIVVQEFETVTFYALFGYKQTSYFLLNKKGARFKSVQ